MAGSDSEYFDRGSKNNSYRSEERRDNKDRRRSRSRDRSRSNGKRSDRNRHESSRRKRGERTPDRQSFWDIPPPGCENMAPSEFKNLRLSSSLPFFNMAQNTTATRQSRRLYIGGIPFGVVEEHIVDFFNAKMLEAKLTNQPGNPVVASQINTEKNYAFVEFRSSEETSAAMVFDGIVFQGQQLKIRRPKDFAPASEGNFPFTFAPPIVAAESLNKLFVACLPVYLNDEQVRELLTAFGELKAFNLVKDSATGLSKGYCFCEYVDPTVTDMAIEGLHGMDIADKKLVVQRAALGAKTGGVQQTNMFPAQLQIPGLETKSLPAPSVTAPSCILCLSNMVDPDELQDDEEYEEIIEDVQEECSKYGNVVSVEIPRPHPDYYVPGVGKVFVEFESIDEAKTANITLTGRKFADRVVVTSYIDPQKYRNKDF